MKSIQEMKEIMDYVEGQWERSIDLLRKVIAGEKLYFIERSWNNDSCYEDDGDYQVTEQGSTHYIGGYYSLIYTKMEYENPLFIGDVETHRPWAICPMFMGTFGEYITNVKTIAGETDTVWETSQFKNDEGKWEVEPLEFNTPLVKALLDAIDGVGIELTSYPKNVRQANAMGLDTRFFG